MKSDITVLIPTSPIKSHPDTAIIDETIASVRHHLPDAEIILQIDGIREEQKDMLDAYNEYKTRVLWKCLHEWKRVLPFVFEEHKHQSSMLKETLHEVKTPLLMYVEGDAPLVTDEKIDWDKCKQMIFDGEANTIRFHHEGVIPEPHKAMMLGQEGDFTKTTQWSQRPHLSTTLYYRDVVLPRLPDNDFIEDHFYGAVQNDYFEDGMIGWYKHRLWIYTPKGNIKRSYHTDGRAGARKFTGDDEAWGLV